MFNQLQLDFLVMLQRSKAGSLAARMICLRFTMNSKLGGRNVT